LVFYQITVYFQYAAQLIMLLIIWPLKTFFSMMIENLAEKLSLCMLNYKSLFYWLGVLDCLS